jgi:prepilin-type processing-associated H-X9-DG protein
MKVYKQRRTYDCHLCCIAMAAQKAPGKIFPLSIRDRIEVDKGSNRSDKTELKKLFAMAGFVEGVDYWTAYIGSQPSKRNVLSLLQGRRAIIQVASLNHENASHVVYWDGHTLHDPSTKQVYRWLDQLVSAEHVTVFNEVPHAPS